LSRAVSKRNTGHPASNLDEIVREPEFVRERIFGSGTVRRVMPGVGTWLAARLVQVPPRLDGMVWSLITFAIWSSGVAAE
jgi:hypothetical protein